MKKLLGEDLFDKTLLNETTEPIYDYIIEKTYQKPGYIEEVVHQDVCFPLNFLFFVIGTGIGQVYFYRKHLN